MNNVRNSGAGTPAILVVEDDPVVRTRVVNSLRQHGFETAAALTREEIFALVDDKRCAALVLDLGLPNDDGVAIARAVRQRSDVPIVMLTGRGGIHARVTGLEAGADDYLVKPFAPEELIARLKAILRRVPPVPAQREKERGLHLGQSFLDLASGELVGPVGKARLTARESALLLALSRSPGPLSREKTYREVFQRNWDPADRSLEVHVAHLRRKLSAACPEPVVISTIRGQGYELCVTARVEYGEPPAGWANP